MLKKLFLSTTHTGSKAERAAETYLTEQGLILKERNYHCRRGEIDLIMQEQDTLVFVEVRLRNNQQFGSGAESINQAKQQKIIITANSYLQKNQCSHQFCRFDVMSLQQNKQGIYQHQWIKNAFEA